MRRFALHSMRDLGMGRRGLEQKVQHISAFLLSIPLAYFSSF
jgi:hypothetical protein